MTIVEALKSENLRISNGDRWLVFDNASLQWVVYERKPYARKTTTVIETDSEELAIAKLIK